MARPLGAYQQVNRDPFGTTSLDRAGQRAQFDSPPPQAYRRRADTGEDAASYQQYIRSQKDSYRADVKAANLAIQEEYNQRRAIRLRDGIASLNIPDPAI